MLINTYDCIVKEYSLHEFNNPQMEKYYKKFLSLIPKKAKILDLGCGPGQAAFRFVKFGHAVTGVDLSKEMINYAKKKVPKANFFVMDVEKIKFSQKFSAVWAAFILVHIDRKKHLSILKKINSLLSKGGVLFLGLLEGEGEKEMLEPYNRDFKQYFVFTSKKEILKNLEQSGFRVVEYSIEEFDEEGDNFKTAFLFAVKG